MVYRLCQRLSDSNGNIVGDTYSGAKSAKEWKQVIEKELEKIKNK